MVLDQLSARHLYYHLHPMFRKAFDFLDKNDLRTLPLGKHEIQGEDLFLSLMEYESKDETDCPLESHRRYIDIQYMVSGEELIGVSFLSENPTVTEPYDASRDIAFYSGPHSSLLKLAAGSFAIFFPNDVHRPSMRSGQKSMVRKGVFKIAVDAK